MHTTVKSVKNAIKDIILNVELLYLIMRLVLLPLVSVVIGNTFDECP